MTIHEVEGAGGVRLHVREWGPVSAPPILLIHGWSQSQMCWAKQTGSSLAEEFRLVALDLRGHGQSDAPLQAEQYTDGDRWADDIAAVIDALALDRPVLAGWSYGGFVICDYLRRHGQDRIAGIDFVGAAVVVKPDAFGTLIGPGFYENAPKTFEADLPTAIGGMRDFLRACLAKPVSQEDFEVLLAFNMVVHPQVRMFLTQRELDFSEMLRGVTVPVKVTHGREETVVLPAMGELIARNCPNAVESWYEGTGHAPFLEDAARYNRELADFVRQARSA